MNLVEGGVCDKVLTAAFLLRRTEYQLSHEFAVAIELELCSSFLLAFNLFIVMPHAVKAREWLAIEMREVFLVSNKDLLGRC